MRCGNLRTGAKHFASQQRRSSVRTVATRDVFPPRHRPRWHEACSNLRYTEAVMIALKKILVATDFGSASESALRYAQALARGFGAELHVLHVVENLLTRAMDGYGY